MCCAARPVELSAEFFLGAVHKVRTQKMLSQEVCNLWTLPTLFFWLKLRWCWVKGVCWSHSKCNRSASFTKVFHYNFIVNLKYPCPIVNLCCGSFQNLRDFHHPIGRFVCGFHLCHRLSEVHKKDLRTEVSKNVFNCWEEKFTQYTKKNQQRNVVIPLMLCLVSVELDVFQTK